MSDRTLLILYGALAVAGAIIVAALALIVYDGLRHLRWWWRRRQDRLGRGGDLMEALARRLE